MSTTLNSTGVTYPDGSTDSDTPLLTVAAQSVGAVGTYALLRNYTGSSNYLPGNTLAGSSLYYSNAYGANWYCYTGTSPAGSWRCMGYSRNPSLGGNPDPVTVWLRYA